MPELPEVETTRRGIDAVITGRKLARLVIHEARMRWPIPPDLPGLLAGRECWNARAAASTCCCASSMAPRSCIWACRLAAQRRAGEFLRKHDHVEWIFDQAVLRLRPTPLRRGAGTPPATARSRRIRCWPGWASSPSTRALTAPGCIGISSAMARHQAGAAGRRGCRRRGQYLRIRKPVPRPHQPEDAGQQAVARPLRPAGRVRARTLADALTSGGSTLRDYVGATGEPGAYFEIHAAVYEREGQPCRVCGTQIKRIVQGQRATYYCPKCQKV